MVTFFIFCSATTTYRIKAKGYGYLSFFRCIEQENSTFISPYIFLGGIQIRIITCHIFTLKNGL
jgi:hypothetical protein